MGFVIPTAEITSLVSVPCAGDAATAVRQLSMCGKGGWGSLEVHTSPSCPMQTSSRLSTVWVPVHLGSGCSWKRLLRSMRVGVVLLRNKLLWWLVGVAGWIPNEQMDS